MSAMPPFSGHPARTVRAERPKNGRTGGFWGAALLVATCAALTGCGGDALARGGPAKGGATVRIGLLSPLSGPFASGGEDMRRGFHLYVDAHRSRLGGRPVEVIDADEGAGPDTGVPAARRLVARDKVTAVAGIVNSAVALGARQTFVEAKVPVVIATAGANALTGAAGSEFIWRTSFANGEYGAALGRWLAGQPPVPGGVFVLTPDYVAGREHLAGFKQAFTAGGGRIAGELYTPFGTTQDFQPFLAQARSSGAGAVYAFYAGADAVNFIRQYREFGLTGRIPLYGAGFLTERDVLSAQGAAAVGVITAHNYSAELDTPANRDFVAAYRAAYRATPSTVSVQAYDAAAVLDAALSTIGAGKNVTGEALVAALGEVGDVQSPRGTWHLNEHRNPEQTFYLRQVRRSGDRYVNAVVEALGATDRVASAAPAAAGSGGVRPAGPRSGWVSDHLTSILNGITLGCLLFVLAVGLSLVFGVLDVLNLAHGSLFLVGAYIAWLVAKDGRPGAFALAALAAAAVGALGGWGLDRATRPLARRGSSPAASHLDQALLTLGIALVVSEAVQWRYGHDPHAVLAPLSGSVDIGGGYPVYRLAVIGAGVILAVAVDLVIERTRLGALVRATVADAPMVAAMGVNTRLVRAGAFAFSGALAAVAGVLGAPILGAHPGLDTEVLLFALVVVVIGGLGSVRGAVVGALIIGQVQSLGVALAPRQAPFLLFGAMAVLLIVRPGGLLGARRLRLGAA